MDKEEKRCGTCRHWQRRKAPVAVNGDCKAPLPAAVTDYFMYVMRETKGTNCLTWEARNG